MKTDAPRTSRPQWKLSCGRLITCATVALAPILPCILAGCATHQTNPASINSNLNGPTTRGLSQPSFDPDVLAICDPPLGWSADPLKKTDDHTHQVWHSPSAATAYGVIHFKLPLPIGCQLALAGFLQKMKKSEGEAVLQSQADDPNLPGIRFVADGGRYKIRTNLIVDGWQGWAIYAGTLRNSPINQNELDLAVAAREHTRVGQPGISGK